MLVFGVAKLPIWDKYTDEGTMGYFGGKVIQSLNALCSWIVASVLVKVTTQALMLKSPRWLSVNLDAHS